MSKIVPKQIIFARKFCFSTRECRKNWRKISFVFSYICVQKKLRSVHNELKRGGKNHFRGTMHCLPQFQKTIQKTLILVF